MNGNLQHNEHEPQVRLGTAFATFPDANPGMPTF
jgi:hypothetical protein